MVGLVSRDRFGSGTCSDAFARIDPFVSFLDARSCSPWLCPVALSDLIRPGWISTLLRVGFGLRATRS